MPEDQLRFFGEPAYNPKLQQWHTPPKLARRMATEFAWVDDDGAVCPVLGPNSVVLEPSGGGGSLVRAALDVGVAGVVVVELDPDWAARLRLRFDREVAERQVVVVQGDFLSTAVQNQVAEQLASFRAPLVPGHELLTVALSNVPFDNGLDGLFLEACLGLVHEHVALTNDNALTGKTRYEQVWSRCALNAVRHLVRRPTFSGAENGGMKDMTVHWSGTHRRRVSGKVIDWWPEAWS